MVVDLGGLFLRKIWFLRFKKACIKKSVGYDSLFFCNLQSSVRVVLYYIKALFVDSLFPDRVVRTK